MSSRIQLQREAARNALQLRRSCSIPREHPVNVYDLAHSVGVQIQFLDLPSLEGMFYRGPDPRIILPSLNHRSRGRVTFTCAHELGHFQLGHGTRVDEYIEDSNSSTFKSDEEAAADAFASMLLMPRPAVLQRFDCRDIPIASASPIDLFVAAGELDVGYSTLLTHLRYGLELVDDSWLREKKKFAPQTIREVLTNRNDVRRVVVVDAQWPTLPIDLELGDYLRVPNSVQFDSTGHLERLASVTEHCLIRAIKAGQTFLNIGAVPVKVRIAREGYVGHFKYRFLEDPELE